MDSLLGEMQSEKMFSDLDTRGCYCSCISRQSSTLKAPRARVVLARRNSEERSLSLQVVSSPMRRAQIQHQTATGLTTVHCPEFFPDISHTVHSHTRTCIHTTGPCRPALRGATNPQFSCSVDINRAGS